MAKYKKNQSTDLSSYYGTYRVKLSNRFKNIAFYVIFLILFTVLFFFTLQQNIHDNFNNEWYNIFFISFYVFLFGFILYESWNLKYKEIIINKEGIRYRSLLKNTFIEKSKIDGYRFYRNKYTGHTLLIKDIKNQKISIYAEDFNYENIWYYLRNITYSLDEKYEKEYELELINERKKFIDKFITLEKNQKEVEAEISSLINICKYINILITVFTLYMMFFGEPYEIFINLGFLILVIMILLMIFYKGKIVFYFEIGFKVPNLSLSFFILTFGLFLRTYGNEIIDDNYVMLYSLIISLLIVSCFYFLDSFKNYTIKIGFINQLVVILFINLYTFISFISFYNCYYDNSLERKYKVKVLDKRIINSKTRRIYYLTINKNIENKYYGEIKIGKNTYNNKQIADSVNVVINDGLLGFKWYYVEKE